jgi:hypothetical protein
MYTVLLVHMLEYGYCLNGESYSLGWGQSVLVFSEMMTS